MENGSPTIGFEDGTIDVECLLVEPEDGHVSMDSVMCFNEKNPENGMDMEDVSCSFGIAWYKAILTSLSSHTDDY